MRFDKSKDITASRIVNDFRENNLVEIFRKYGEVSQARLLAEKIINNRPINSARQLKIICEKVVGWKNKKIHPATTVFQALRIAVNDELNNLETILRSLDNIIAPKGIIAIISFHSLEDRLVKINFRQLIENGKFEYVGEKFILPTEEEIAQNESGESW